MKKTIPVADKVVIKRLERFKARRLLAPVFSNDVRKYYKPFSVIY